MVLFANSLITTAIVPSVDVTISNAGVTSIGTVKEQPDMLAENAVITSKILDSKVTANKIASNAVTTVKIANANVTAGKLAHAPPGGNLFDKVLTTDAAGNNTRAYKTQLTLPETTDKQLIVANGITPAAVSLSCDATNQ